MRTTALATALLLAAAPLPAQVIRGTLVDAATRAPVAGASVRLVSARGVEGDPVLTDSAGAFTVWARYAGAFRLRAERLGYTPSLSPEVGLAGRDSVRVLFRISASAVVMEPLQVVSHVRRRSPRLAGFLRRSLMDRGGWFATREDIEAATPNRVSDVLRSARGIHLRMVYQGVGYQVRGRGECLPAVFLDGFPLGQDGAKVDEWMHPNDLEGVEVYPDAALAPPQYGGVASNGCSIILLWTRDGYVDEG